MTFEFSSLWGRTRLLKAQRLYLHPLSVDIFRVPGKLALLNVTILNFVFEFIWNLEERGGESSR